MPDAKQPVALFVSHRALIHNGGGGAQWCTREYRASLAAAGFRLVDVHLDTDTSYISRLRRKITPRPHDHLPVRRAIRSIVATAQAEDASWCFLNNADAGSLAAELRRHAPSLRLVFLSHGVELTDVVNNLRLAPDTLPAGQHNARWLGRLLLDEVAQRRALDATLCISAGDCELERWLGSPATLFLPRQIPHNPLPLAPVNGRLGVVATLDHGPNSHGIELLAAALQSFKAISLRVVGRPQKTGEALARRFASVHYCGRLDEPDLRAEAATWCAFANPIFCPARGASTKVATALGWGLPVLTTPQGARGYEWDTNLLPLPETPEALAALAQEATSTHTHERWITAANSLRLLAPKTEDSARELRNFLTTLPHP